MDYINKYDELIQILCKIRDKAISALSDTAFSETALVYKREIDDLIKKMLKDKDFNLYYNEDLSVRCIADVIR